MENNEQKLTRKKDNYSIRVAFSAMIAFVMFLAEIYLMIHGAEYFIGLVTVTVLLLADLYILVTSIIQMNYQKEQRLLDEIDDLFKSEKATYLLLRKNFNEINERLLYVEDNLKTPTEEIIAAQKAVAKVTISRNKENSDALMNSNDKLLERFFSFEDLLASNNDKMLEQQKLILDQTSKEILMKQQESVAKLKELELSIKNEILQSVNTITSVQQKIVMAPQPQMEIQSQNQPVETLSIHNMEEEQGGLSIDELLKEAEVSSMDDLMDGEFEIGMPDDGLESTSSEDAETDLGTLADEEVTTDSGVFADEEPEIDLGTFADEEPEIDMGDFTDEEPEIDMGDFIDEEPEINLEVLTEESLPMPDLSDPNKMMSTEDIAALLANVGGEEPIAEEPVIEESVIEEPVIETAVEEEMPSMPDMSDPNKIMSPEDIAALLTNVGGEESIAEEPVIEEQVVEEPIIEEPVIEAAVEEEKPPMPDMSDPNKIMSPEDIAALLANM